MMPVMTSPLFRRRNIVVAIATGLTVVTGVVAGLSVDRTAQADPVRSTAAAKTVTYVVPRDARVHVRIQAPTLIAGPLQYHAHVGTAVVFAGRRVIARVPLLLAHRLPAVSPITLAAKFITRPFTLVVIAVLLGGVIGLVGVWRWRSRVRSAADPRPA